uniref:Uncharacterized protein n=1 Tax=mine drainage metagenome TaxID=410659 RepID=E6QNR5_9ZZZZ
MMDAKVWSGPAISNNWTPGNVTISTDRGEIGENGGSLVIFAKVAAFILSVNYQFSGNRDGRATKKSRIRICHTP